MNRSGEVLPALKAAGNREAMTMIVVCDNMDLEPGLCRLKKRGSSGGHNGLKSIDAHFGGDYYRLYIGIGRPEHSGAVTEHVLSAPPEKDNLLIREALGRAAEALLDLSVVPAERVMNEINRKNPA